MEFTDVNNKTQEIHAFSDLDEWLEKCNGVNILISAIGDRKSVVKFKCLQCFIINNFRNEQCLVLMESMENEEDCQELHINIKDVVKVQVLEWEEHGDLEGFHIVFTLHTGNELHINKAA